MGRFDRTLTMARASWAVLKKDRELLVFPVLSFICSLGVLLAFVIPAFLLNQDLVDRANESGGADVSPATYAFGLLATIGVTFVSVFFTAAMVSGAHERLTGGDPTVGSAIGGAMRRLPQLFGWTLVSTTVGMIIRSIQDKGLIGRIVASFVSMAWAVLTFLVVPIVVIEGTGPFAAIGRSTELFKRTWGENLISQAGFGLLGLLLIVPAIVVVGLLVAVGQLALSVVAILVGVVYVAAVVVVLSALGAIFKTALYHYAAHGVLVGGFEDAGLESSFRVR